MTGQATAKGSSTSKSLVRPSVLLAIAATLAIGGYSTFILRQFRLSPASQAPEVQVSQPKITTVTALGRLEPKGETIKLSAPASANGSRVEQLLVKEGDVVKAGQIVAILDSRDRLQAALEEAQEKVRVSKAELAKVLAGAKIGEIKAQQATIARVEAERRNDLKAQAATMERLAAELRTAQVEYQRYQMLYKEGATSAQQRDDKLLSFEAAQKKLEEAKANLNRIRSAQQQQIFEAKATLDKIAEVRPVDVQAAQANVSSALATVKRARAELEDAYVRAPQDCQILKIHTRAGEQVSSQDGIAEIGQTQQMYAVAEVYQSDISKVRVGQPVQVTSGSLPGEELHGTVERIGLRVQRQEVINSDPSANIDDRIVEVKVRLDGPSSQKVAGLTNLQVRTVIKL